MRSKAISWGAKFLFGIIAKANKEKVKWSKKYLADRMDCSRREVQNRIGELKSNNLILVNRQGRAGRVSEYTVNLELLSIVQGGRERPFSTQNVLQGREHSVPGGGERSVLPYSKEHSLKNIIKEDDFNNINLTGLKRYRDLKAPLQERRFKRI